MNLIQAIRTSADSFVKDLSSNVINEWSRFFVIEPQIRSQLNETFFSIITDTLLPSTAHLYHLAVIREYQAARDGHCSSISKNINPDTSWLDGLAAQRAQNLARNYIAALRRIAHHHIKRELPFPIYSVSDIEDPGSETHHGGQRPIFFTFDQTRKLSYKPKNCDVHNVFNSVVDTISSSANISSGGLRAPTVYVGGKDYAISEFVENECELCCDTDARSYFIQVGTLLAVALIYRITDLHFENLVATKAGPVVIDLEMMFHRYSSRATVCVTGLLPNNQPSSGALMGGKGVKELGVFQDRQRVGDNVVFERQVDKSQSWAYFNGERIQASDYLDEILYGFEHAYKSVLAQNELRPSHVLKKANQTIQIRHLIRPTRYYVAKLCELVTHVDARRKLVKSRLQSDLLKDVGIGGKVQAKLVDVETECILTGDVPHFTSTPDDLSLYSSGREVCPAYFHRTLHEELRDFEKQLGPAHMQQQAMIVRSKLER